MMAPKSTDRGIGVYLRDTPAQLISVGIFMAFTLGSLIAPISLFLAVHWRYLITTHSYQCQQLIQSPMPFLTSILHEIGAARSKRRHNAVILDEPANLPDLALYVNNQDGFGTLTVQVGPGPKEIKIRILS